MIQKTMYLLKFYKDIDIIVTISYYLNITIYTRENKMNNDFEKYREAAELLRVLSHPVRICIIRGLLKKGECNVTYMQSCLDIPQSTISQHLQKLKIAGIIEGRRNGLEVHYSVCNKKVIDLVNNLIED
jgi:DNA-binding transcriptional ArsR family regulator